MPDELEEIRRAGFCMGAKLEKLTRMTEGRRKELTEEFEKVQAMNEVEPSRRS